MIKILSLALFVFAFSAHAEKPSQILELKERNSIQISHGAGGNWKVEDFVCAERDGRSVACGVVTVSTPENAVVQLDFANEEVQVGDSIVRPKSRKSTGGDTIKPSANVHFLGPYHPRNWFRGAMLWDVNHWFVTASYERATSTHVAWGAKLDIFDAFNVNKSLDGFGVLLSRTYFTRPNFTGVSGQIAAGPFFFTGTDPLGLQAKSVSFILEISASMRFQIARFAAIGFNFGIRYITKPSMPINYGVFHPLRAALGLEIAFRI